MVGVEYCCVVVYDIVIYAMEQWSGILKHENQKQLEDSTKAWQRSDATVLLYSLGYGLHKHGDQRRSDDFTTMIIN